MYTRVQSQLLWAATQGRPYNGYMLETVLLLFLGFPGRSRTIAFERPTQRPAVEQKAAAGAFIQRVNGRLAVVARLGERRTGGYEIRITRLTLSGSTLTVRARITEPAKNAIVTQAFTYPVDAVVVAEERLPRDWQSLKVVLVDEKGKPVRGEAAAGPAVR